MSNRKSPYTIGASTSICSRANLVDLLKLMEDLLLGFWSMQRNSLRSILLEEFSSHLTTSMKGGNLEQSLWMVGSHIPYHSNLRALSLINNLILMTSKILAQL